jgi:uncharacterized membrane protein
MAAPLLRHFMTYFTQEIFLSLRAETEDIVSVTKAVSPISYCLQLWLSVAIALHGVRVKTSKYSRLRHCLADNKLLKLCVYIPADILRNPCKVSVNV